MEEKKLLREYRTLCPDLKTIYVIPDIKRFSRHNSYLDLLYQDLHQHHSIQLISFSFLSPWVIIRRLAGEKSILHHHWLECHNLRSLFNILWKFFWVTLYKAIGGKIVWTIHNKFPHQARYRRINLYLRKCWAKLPHRIHVHCKAAIPIMSSVLNISDTKFFIIEHPVYPIQQIAPRKARELLNKKYLSGKLIEESLIFLMFGYIARYKGIQETVNIFKELAPPKLLLIAGQVKKGNQKYFEKIVQSANQASNIIFFNQYIQEEDIAIFINACDFGLFNYQDILTSGGVRLLQSYSKKIIIPRIGCLKEITGKHVFPFSNQQELRDILNELPSENWHH